MTDLFGRRRNSPSPRVADATGLSPEECEPLFIDRETGWLIPNTEVRSNGKLIVKVNRLGCAGYDLVPDVPVIGYFGDSTTMGHTVIGGWPGMVSIPGTQNLNAGIQGHNMTRVTERYRILGEKIDFAAVVVYSAWHNLIYGECDEAHWDKMLRTFLGDHATAFCTVGTSLTEEFRDRGYDGNFRYIELIGKNGFTLWGNQFPGKFFINRLLDQIAAYNDFIRRLCEDTGAVLIDLHSLLLPERYENAPVDFSDAGHMRPSTYPRIADHVSGALAEPVAGILRTQGERKRRFLKPGAGDILDREKTRRKPQEEQVLDNLYTLW